jgi:pseudaminic acid synthase
LHELYQEAHTPWDWHAALFARGRERGLVVLSSPFDPTAVELLEDLEVPAYKIASFEIVDLPLIRCVAATGKPMIISTGIANLDEISEAVEAAQNGGASGVLLLHCISGYPTPVADSNLLQIGHLAAHFDCPIGLSDHTLGVDVSIAAVAMGACVIEKHITLARADGGPDAAFSLEPDELTRLAEGVRTAYDAQGRTDYGRAGSEAGNIMFRRSLYAVRNIGPGEVFTQENVRSIRPGYGLPPKQLPEILGKSAAEAIPRGTPLSVELIAS